MAPPKKPWFRMYCEITGDRKLRSLPPDLRWVWVAVMALARTSPVPNHLMVSESLPCSDDDIADEAAVTVAKARQALTAFAERGMIHRNEELRCWVVTNFGRRQFESDDSTPRSRKKRDATAMQRPINGDATHQSSEAETEAEVSNSQQQLQTPPSDPRFAAALRLHIAQAVASGRTETPVALLTHVQQTQGAELRAWLAEHPDASAVDAAVQVLGSQPEKPTLSLVPAVEPELGFHGPPKPAISQDEHIARTRARAEAGDLDAIAEMAAWDKRVARKQALSASGGMQ